MTTAEETRTATAPGHALDPLSKVEIEAVTAIVKAAPGGPQQLGFVEVSLREPPKAAILAGERTPRRAWVVALDRSDGRVFEGVVNLDGQSLESWEHRPGVQPFPMYEEFALADRVAREDPGWQAAVRRRGLDDFSKVQIDPWPAGNFGDPLEQGRRILRCISYVRDEPASNGYARPIEGLVAVVDVIEQKVISLVDEETAPIPSNDSRYHAESVGVLREDLKPLDITQPEGVSFELEGNLLRWQRWQMRISHHGREGLVLHQVGYEDGGDLRPICYRASMAEMVVPYGDTSAGQYWKNAFDSGEVGLGRLTNSLELGCDCLGEIRYLDGAVVNADGSARVIKNAICIHEEDFGILWKHTDGHNEGASEVRRSRRLVVSSFATVGNYDYGFYWYFYQDGTIEHEVKATGIIQTMAVAAGDQAGTRQLVAPGLAGPIHQHFFSFRMDLDIDGTANRVDEIDTVPLAKGPGNPHGNAFHPIASRIGSERDAGREVRTATARFWKVSSAGRKNAVGEATAYALFPGETVPMMAHEDSAVARRATFARKQLWVTRHDDSERYPAGEYPAQSTGGDGMPAWLARDRRLEDEDVVLWYTVGLNHIVRPEDFPVAPVHRAGFRLKPWGFFDRNPALDVAPPEVCHHE